jgi:hypothetical protein
MNRGTAYARAVAIVVAMAFTAPAAAAVQEQEPQRGRANRAAPALTNAELITMLDAYAIVQAQNALQLSDEQYGQFVARLKRLQETRRRNTIARTRMVQELRRLTAPASATDEATLRDRVKALRDFDDQAAQAMRREHDALDEVLDARQQARFRVFEERIEQQKLDLLVRARERAARTAPARRNDGGQR